MFALLVSHLPQTWTFCLFVCCVWVFDMHIVCVSLECLIPEEGVGSPGTEVTESCEPPYGCWEWTPGAQQEQTVLRTAEPSPHLHPTLNF